MSGRTDCPTRTASMTRARPSIARLFLLLMLMLAWPVASAKAGINEFDVYKSVMYNQTSEAPPTASTGAFFAARVFFDGPGQATDVYGVLGGTTPLIYSAQPGNSFLYQTTPYSSSAAMDSVFTSGLSDKVTLSGGTLGTQSAGFTLAADSYTSTLPSLTGGSYTALQGVNSGGPITLNFTGFSPGVGVNEADIFVSIIRNSDNATVYSSGGMSNTTTSLTLAPNLLAAGTSYTVDLDYSSRVDSFNVGFNGATLVQAFDQRTEIKFFAASVPEPSSMIMTALGAAMAGLAVVRRWRSRPAA